MEAVLTFYLYTGIVCSNHWEEVVFTPQSIRKIFFQYVLSWHHFAWKGWWDSMRQGHLPMMMDGSTNCRRNWPICQLWIKDHRLINVDVPCTLAHRIVCLMICSFGDVFCYVRKGLGIFAILLGNEKCCVGKSMLGTDRSCLWLLC